MSDTPERDDTGGGVQVTVKPEVLLAALNDHPSEDVGEVATDGLLLWSELENSREMIADVDTK